MSRNKNLSFWALPPEKAGPAAMKLLGKLEQRMESTHTQWLSNIRLYLDRRVPSLSSPTSSLLARTTSRKNVVDSAVSTVMSMTLRMPLRAIFQPHGASYGVQRTCEQLTLFATAIQDKEGLREGLTELAALDALIYGFGCVRPDWHSTDGKKAGIELRRILPWTLHYDVIECQNGHPPLTLLETDLVDRDLLAERFPEKAETIREAQIAVSPTATSACAYVDKDETASTVRILRAWRRGTDGVHDIYLLDGNNATLLERVDYKHNHFPHAFCVWQKAPVGWVCEARSLVEQLRGHQERLDRLVEKIDTSFDMAPAVILLPKGSGVDSNEISNELGFPVLESNSEMPQFFSPTPVHPQYLAQERQTISDTYDMTGVSQSQATASKPSGVESGIALQHLSDEASVRFQGWALSYAKLHGDNLQAIVRTAQDAEEAGYQAVATKELHEPIKFGEIDLKDLAYTVSVQVLPNAPRTPAKQIDLAMQMMNSGLYSRETALTVLTEFSDNVTARRLEEAARDAVRRDINHIITKKEPRLPDLDDMAFAVEHSRRIYLMYRDELEDDAKALLLEYREIAEAILKEQMNVAAAAQQPPNDPNAAAPV